MKKIIIMIMVVCMLLCACSKAPAEQTTDAANNTTAAIVTTEGTTATEATQATEETTAPTTEETVPVVLYRNPLNGTPLDEPHTARPFAVVINNIVYAQPVCSVGQADFLFEVLAEGGITRCLAVFDNIAGLNHIGAIRSTRPYLVDMANSFDAIFVHHGGSSDGYNKISELGTDNLDFLGNAGSSYYRDQNRLNNGYDLEHTSFADGDDLIETADDCGYAAVREDGVDYGYVFDDVGSTTAGESAVELKVTFGDNGKSTTFNYDEVTGLYTATQYGDTMIDGNTDEAVAFRNVLMITANTYDYVKNDVTRVHIDLVGEGTGYFACDGKVVQIRWSRSGDFEPFVFTHEDGTPITLGVGSTYVAITPLSRVLEY